MIGGICQNNFVVSDVHSLDLGRISMWSIVDVSLIFCSVPFTCKFVEPFSGCSAVGVTFVDNDSEVSPIKQKLLFLRN